MRRRNFIGSAIATVLSVVGLHKVMAREPAQGSKAVLSSPGGQNFNNGAITEAPDSDLRKFPRTPDEGTHDRFTINLNDFGK